MKILKTSNQNVFEEYVNILKKSKEKKILKYASYVNIISPVSFHKIVPNAEILTDGIISTNIKNQVLSQIKKALSDPGNNLIHSAESFENMDVNKINNSDLKNILTKYEIDKDQLSKIFENLKKIANGNYSFYRNDSGTLIPINSEWNGNPNTPIIFDTLDKSISAAAKLSGVKNINEDFFNINLLISVITIIKLY